MAAVRAVVTTGMLALALAPVAAQAQTSFTGTIEYRTSTARGATGMLVENNRDSEVSFEIRTPEGRPVQSVGGVIYDARTGVAYVLFPGNHAYVRLTRDDMRYLAHDIEARVAARNPEATRANTLSITPTGTSRTVAGVACQMYRVSGTERGRAIADEACIAKNVGLSPYDLPEQGLLTGPMGQTGWLAIVREALRGGRGVLELRRNGAGQASVALEATHIDHRPPADSLFAPPSTYRAVSLQEAIGEELPAPSGRGQSGR